MSQRRFGLLFAHGPQHHAEELRVVLTQGPRATFSEDHVAVLKDVPPPDVLLRIQLALRASRLEDLVLVYYSGPAVLSSAGRLHLGDGQALSGSLAPAPALQVVLVLDCQTRGPSPDGLLQSRLRAELERISRERSLVLLASPAKGTPGVMTRDLVDAIRRGAPGRDESLTVEDLHSHAASLARGRSSREPDLFVPDGRRGLVLARAAEASEAPAVPAAAPTYLQQEAVPHPGGAALCVVRTPGGRQFLSGGVDGRLRAWDLCGTGNLPRVVEAHQGPICSLAFSPDGRTLASSGGEAALLLWDVLRATPRAGPIRGVHAALSLSFDPRSRRIASAGLDGIVNVHEAGSGTLVASWDSGQGGLQAVAFGLDGKALATAGKDGTIRLWDPSEWSPLRTIRAHLGRVQALRFGPDGKELFSCGRDGTVKGWDTGSWALMRSLASSYDPVQSLALSPDGACLASGSASGEVTLWDLAAGLPTQLLECGRLAVESLEFARDAALLAAASADGLLRTWRRARPRGCPSPAETAVAPDDMKRDGEFHDEP